MDLSCGSPTAKVLNALLSQILGHDARMCSQHDSMNTSEDTGPPTNNCLSESSNGDNQPNKSQVTSTRTETHHMADTHTTEQHVSRRNTKCQWDVASIFGSIKIKTLFHWANYGFSVERHWNHGFVFVSLATRVFTLERGGRQRFTSTHSVGFAWVSQHSCVVHSFLSCGFHPFCPCDLCRFMTLRSSTASH